MNNNYQILSGNEAAVLAAVEAGAEIMFGYPITPSTEILQGWSKKVEENHNLQFLQTEDETSAGFGVNGAILGGVKAFTATSGPGHILMQDPLAMAENLRLPFVAIIMQRGGPSTGTVNYSQQEVNLACFGGNGDGLRIVYSASSVLEMYDLTHKAFLTAWKYRFPTFVLGDGYLGKMREKVQINQKLNTIRSEKILAEKKVPTYLRNCYSSEESFGLYLEKNIRDWKNITKQVFEYEMYRTKGSNELIIAHGIVASACKEAINYFREKGRKIDLFRPIVLNPFDSLPLKKVIKNYKNIYIIESSLNQLARIIKYETYGSCTPVTEISKPAEGFTPDEIIEALKS